jgi:DNA-binding response OmpR family regulator
MTSGPIPIGRDEPVYLAELRNQGIAAVVVSSEYDIGAIRDPRGVALVLLDAASMSREELRTCVRQCSRLELPTIALVTERQLNDLDASIRIGDFVVAPARPAELVLRAQRLLTSHSDDDEAIHVGDLTINRTNYEVAVRGRNVNLRFKEYELLLLMATNPGRVYSRDQLLEQIWGYDYLGGTRTVDVHVRRLRSKIDDRNHQFIETVWNVGYRFKVSERR